MQRPLPKETLDLIVDDGLKQLAAGVYTSDPGIIDEERNIMEAAIDSLAADDTGMYSPSEVGKLFATIRNKKECHTIVNPQTKESEKWKPKGFVLESLVLTNLRALLRIDSSRQEAV